MSLGQCLKEDLGRLPLLDLAELRAFWTDRFGEPPPLRSKTLLRHLIAWRLQVAVHGGLDQDTLRKLTGRGRTEAVGLNLGHGAVIRRQWEGKVIEVIVEETGFRWNDENWPSLSAIAREATGTRRNGPRFFGLRNGAP